MFAVLLLAATANAKCYDGAGNFKLATWPRCQEATPSLSVYSGLSADGQFVTLGLQAQGHTKGWSAIGFSGNGGMKGASQIVVRMEGGQWVAEDRYSLDYVTPTLDPEQNVRLLFAQDNGVNTSWGVIIPRDSCDENDYASENVSRPFLWALGSSHTFAQHAVGSRGSFYMNVINGLPQVAPLTDVTEVKMQMANVSVISGTGDATNPYICTFFDLREALPGRNFSDFVHVARFAPYVAPGNEGYIHHMVLYGCTSNEGYSHGTVLPSCQAMPSGCTNFKWVWAVGSHDVQFPDNVGMPLGGGLYFLVLQMHYYNPLLLTNVYDSSGVSLFFTGTNRPINAGLLQVNGGTSIRLRPNLPANTSRFTLTPSFVVPSVCTQEWTEPLNIVGAIHHMHMLGVQERLEVSRNGVNLGLVRRERVYDFKHQSLEEPLIHQLLPGDELQLWCDYDTSGKMAETQFGENTNNEMCWSALMYYPAQGFTNAVVQPTPSVPELAKLGAICQTESPTYPNTSTSLCAQMFFNDPIVLILGRASNLTLQQWCNDMPVNSPQVYAQVIGAAPILCPACGANRNCTVPELVGHSQALCASQVCGKAAISIYPDLSQPPVFREHRLWCDTKGNEEYVLGKSILGPNSTFPSPPACVRKGDLANASAVSAASAAVLRDQGNSTNSTNSTNPPKDNSTQLNSGSLIAPPILVLVMLALAQRIY